MQAKIAPGQGNTPEQVFAEHPIALVTTSASSVRGSTVEPYVGGKVNLPPFGKEFFPRTVSTFFSAR